MIILWWSKSFRSGSGSYYSDPNFFALDHIILWWSKFFCSGSWSFHGDPNIFSVDHIILVVIQILLAWIMIILNSMIWSFWSKSNDQWSFVPTPEEKRWKFKTSWRRINDRSILFWWISHAQHFVLFSTIHYEFASCFLNSCKNNQAIIEYQIWHIFIRF